MIPSWAFGILTKHGKDLLPWVPKAVEEAKSLWTNREEDWNEAKDFVVGHKADRAAFQRMSPPERRAFIVRRDRFRTFPTLPPLVPWDGAAGFLIELDNDKQTYADMDSYERLRFSMRTQRDSNGPEWMGATEWTQNKR